MPTRATGAEPNRGGTVEYPDDVRYTKEHEWSRAENGRVRIGITDYAQDALGDVVYVDLPDPGTVVQAKRPFAEVESTKSVSDVYAPVDGTIVEKNPLLDERPELVNEEPYGDGWLVIVEPAHPDALDGLLDATAYRAFLQEPDDA
jgi:glycine cleavage system H protein